MIKEEALMLTSLLKEHIAIIVIVCVILLFVIRPFLTDRSKGTAERTKPAYKNPVTLDPSSYPYKSNRDELKEILYDPERQYPTFPNDPEMDVKNVFTVDSERSTPLRTKVVDND